MPDVPKITHEALKPFLRGLSPYGPRSWSSRVDQQLPARNNPC